MAIVPVSNVLVDVKTSSGTSIGQAMTNANGQYSVTWQNVSEANYNATGTQIQIQTSKLGYINGGALVNKPAYTAAVNSGISVNALIQRDAAPVQFDVTPESTDVGWNDTAGFTFTVQCPDNTWTIGNVPTWVTATKVSQTQLLVRANTNNTGASYRSASISVIWQGETEFVTFNQLAQGALPSGITFFGKVLNNATGSPIANSPAQSITIYGIRGGVWDVLGRTNTNSSGNYSITVEIGESTWNQYDSISVTAQISGYITQTQTVATPTYINALSNGVNFPDIRLNAQGGGAQIAISPANPTIPTAGSTSVVVTVSNAPGGFGLSTSDLGGRGYIVYGTGQFTINGYNGLGAYNYPMSIYEIGNTSNSLEFQISFLS